MRIRHELTLAQVRAKASKWHAKETLSLEERRMLQVIEELLREVDGDDLVHVWPSQERRDF